MLKPLGWDKIVTSDLGRAAHTAALLNESLGLPIFHEPRLREQDWGQWTGLTLEVIMHENARELNRLLSAGWDFQPPGGESRQQVWQRGAAALRALAAIGPQTRVLVVAHGGLIRALTYRLLHRRFDPGEPALIEKRHLHLLRAQDGCLHLDRLNALRLP
jgi:probable phosphoglycerate mutase